MEELEDRGMGTPPPGLKRPCTSAPPGHGVREELRKPRPSLRIYNPGKVIGGGNVVFFIGVALASADTLYKYPCGPFNNPDS